MRKNVLILLVCTMMIVSCVAFASEHDYVNDNAYWADIRDEADIFDNETDILSSMKYVTEYTNILVYTTDSNSSTSSSFARQLAQSHFRSGDGVVFLIDMDNRYIYIYAHNDTSDIITELVADTITDNCYDYASDKHYDQCAKEAISQIYRKLSGKSIPEPMRYIGNIFLAVMIGVSLTAVFACYSSRIQVSEKTTKDVDVRINDKQRDIIDVKRVYRSSSSSGSSGGSRSGGGGGGSRGGGGGHRF